MVVPIIIILVIFHVWGTRKNRRKARDWSQAHAAALRNEFAVVGFGGIHKASGEDKDAVTPELDNILKEKTAQEYISYATGRQNIAFVDIAV